MKRRFRCCINRAGRVLGYSGASADCILRGEFDEESTRLGRPYCIRCDDALIRIHLPIAGVRCAGNLATIELDSLDDVRVIRLNVEVEGSLEVVIRAVSVGIVVRQQVERAVGVALAVSCRYVTSRIAEVREMEAAAVGELRSRGLAISECIVRISGEPVAQRECGWWVRRAGGADAQRKQLALRRYQSQIVAVRALDGHFVDSKWSDARPVRLCLDERE